MSRFIALHYILDTHGNKGGTLINVNEIQSVTATKDAVFVKPKGGGYPFKVAHTLEEVMKMIDKAGGTIIKPKGATADHTTDPAVVQLFEDLLDTYGRHAGISKALQTRFPIYAKLTTHSLTERLKRLQVNHEKLDTLASKRNLLNDCKALLDQQVEAK